MIQLYNTFISIQRNLINKFFMFIIFIFPEHIIQNMVTILIANYLSYHLFIMVSHQLIFDIIRDFYGLLKSKKGNANITILYLWMIFILILLLMHLLIQPNDPNLSSYLQFIMQMKHYYQMLNLLMMIQKVMDHP